MDEIAAASIVTTEVGDETLKGLLPVKCNSVEVANHLAMSIEELWQRERLYQKYLAVLTVEQPETMEDALHYTVRLDDYELVPEDDYEYGQTVLRRNGATDEVLGKLIGYMNMEGLGRDAQADDGVRKTEFGSIRRCSEPFPGITHEMKFGGM